MHHRYFIKLSYLGTHYNGWQSQENTPNTLQQVITERLSGLVRESLSITGCGRTDTGVHAKEYYAHFDSTKDDLHSDPSLWLHKMNRVLPTDIAIQQIIPVSSEAHARFDATSRTYTYFVNRKKDPFAIDRSYFVPGPLDIEKMDKTAAILFDYNDYSCFSKSNTQVKNNECKLMHAQWLQEKDMLIFTITANRFLRNMVRAIVGTLLEVGREKISPTSFREIIEGKNRSEAGYSVPAHGLYLTKIQYPENIFLND